jgi:DNA repair exonuclease SbcCD ATPase subunit
VWFDENGNIVDDVNLAAKTPYYENSLTWKNERIQKKIDAVPGLKEDAEAIAKDKVDAFKANVDAIKAKVNAYKDFWTGYDNWLKECRDAEKDYNDALKEVFDAKQKYNAAKADFEAAEAAANQTIFVYTGEKPGTKITIGGKKYTVDGEGFIELSIEDEIERLEGSMELLVSSSDALIAIASDLINDVMHVEQQSDAVDMIKKALAEIQADKNRYIKGNSNFELNLVKKILEEALSYGKVALSTVVNAYDAEIDQLDEEIVVWDAIANKYKTIMNAYLGIVEEGVVAEPVVEEGDEE